MENKLIPFSRFAIFASGSGSNALALIKKSIELGFPPECLIVNKRNSPLLLLREEIKCEVYYVSSKNMINFENEAYDICKKHKVDWIFLAGFLKVLSAEFLKKFNIINKINRVVNIHPSLLPKYPGLGGYEKAILNKDKFYGHTIHLVTSEVDCGPILMQKKFPLDLNQTESEIITFGKKQENITYQSLIQSLITNGLYLTDGVPRVEELC